MYSNTMHALSSIFVCFHSRFQSLSLSFHFGLCLPFWHWFALCWTAPVPVSVPKPATFTVVTANILSFGLHSPFPPSVWTHTHQFSSVRVGANAVCIWNGFIMYGLNASVFSFFVFFSLSRHFCSSRMDCSAHFLQCLRFTTMAKLK